MTFENRDLVRDKRYTIRAQSATDEVIRMAAQLTGVQPSTFIHDSALQRGLELIRRAQEQQGQKSNA